MTKIQKAILEAGEEDEEKKDEEKKDEEKKDEDSGAEDAGNVDSDDDSDLTDDTAFAGLDLRAARCFGFQAPSKNCWTGLAVQAEDLGWKHIDMKALEKNLAQDVEASYRKIAQFRFVNVDDDMAYTVWFDNNASLWNVQIADSPKAELDVQERADFFKADLFKKTAQKTYERLGKAKNLYYKIVNEHINSGEFLLVDTVKLDAILSFLDDDHFLENVLERTYLGQ